MADVSHGRTPDRRAAAGSDSPYAGGRFRRRPGEIVCVVGGIGSGKSVSRLHVMGLLPRGETGRRRREAGRRAAARPPEARYRELRGTRGWR